MATAFSKALHKTITITRILGKLKGSSPGPTVVFFGGIHGNEPAGVFALNEVLKELDPAQMKGTIYAVGGNLQALEHRHRYIDQDLNRLWTKDQIETVRNKINHNSEEMELLELLDILKSVLKTGHPPFYFIDLHTTSSKTLPFITINDALINRKFARLFPVPIVLGIEEYLNGPLLSYINELGYVSLGFESGQHDTMAAITNHKAFIHLALVYSGVMKAETLHNVSKEVTRLQNETHHIASIFEIMYLYRIQPQDRFKMLNGFKSFQKIARGTQLAVNNNTEITSAYNARIFMPLYQKQGEEGFFIIRPIPPFVLNLSALLRHTKVDGWLTVLPGISWFNKQEGILKVNLKVARFLAKSFFHLLGYRNKQLTPHYLRMHNRERVAKTKSYKKEGWY